MELNGALAPIMEESSSHAMKTPRAEILGLVEKLAGVTLLKPPPNVYEPLMDYLTMREEGLIPGEKIPFNPMAAKVLARMRVASTAPRVVNSKTGLVIGSTLFKYNIPVPCCARTFVLEEERDVPWYRKLCQQENPAILQEREVMTKVRALSEMIVDATDYGAKLLEAENYADNVDDELPLPFEFMSSTTLEKFAVEEWIPKKESVEATGAAQMAQSESPMTPVRKSRSKGSKVLVPAVSSSDFEFPDLEFGSDEDFLGGDDELRPDFLFGEVSDSIPALTQRNTSHSGEVNANVDPIPDSKSPEVEIYDVIHSLMLKINVFDEQVVGKPAPAVGEAPAGGTPSTNHKHDEGKDKDNNTVENNSSDNNTVVNKLSDNITVVKNPSDNNTVANKPSDNNTVVNKFSNNNTVSNKPSDNITVDSNDNTVDVNISKGVGDQESPATELESGVVEPKLVAPPPPRLHRTVVSSLTTFPRHLTLEPELPPVRFTSDVVTRRERDTSVNPPRQELVLEPRVLPAQESYSEFFFRQFEVMADILVGNVGLFDAPLQAIALGLLLYGLICLSACLWTLFAQ